MRDSKIVSKSHNTADQTMTNISELEAVKGKPKNEIEISFDESQKQKKNEPPSFYEDDQQKWMKKFEKSIKDRQIEKKIIELKLNGAQPYYGVESKSKIYHIKEAMEKARKSRPRSRYSKNTFNNVDFNYKGNSEYISK